VDIFKFTNPTHPTKMEQGRIINGLKSKLWVERFFQPGEFTLVAPLGSGAAIDLPPGTFISHVDTKQVMVVENQEMSVERNKEPDVIITGRSLEVLYEGRVVGATRTGPTPAGGANRDYTVTNAAPWLQLRQLISAHTQSLANVNDELPWLYPTTTLAAVTPVVTDKTYKVGDLYASIRENLDAYLLGIESVRPSNFPIVGTVPPAGSTYLNIYSVEDNTSTVFAYDLGEVDRAQYLWSNKKLKNTAIVIGKWVIQRVDAGPVKEARRMIFVDGTSIDDSYTTTPAGATLTTIQAEMTKRGQEAIDAHNALELSKAEASDRITRLKYRYDYKLGDIVTVTGDFGTETHRIVSEYVEIEDEKGVSGQPTFFT
jgi:hypothetical protein